MSEVSAFNLMGWIEENRHLLKPPMLNKPVWRDRDFIVMILAGPIARNDYHVNPYEEFFYQLEGNMTLKVIEDGVPADVPITEGNVFLLPPLIPHSPQRPEAGSIGLVVERTRPTGQMDGFEWYCRKCTILLHRGELQLARFAEDRPPLFDHFYEDISPKGCPECGAPGPLRGTPA